MRGLICDDHPLMREALGGAMRDRWPSLTLLEASDYPSAWAAVGQEAVDFCLVDLAMPGADPIAGIGGLRERAADAVIMVVTGLTDAALLDHIRALGVAAVFSKNAETELLIEAILAHAPGLQALEAGRLPPRQQEVLALLAEGLTNKEIGQRLGISPATVKIHVARLIGWLGAVNRTDAVARAQRARII